MTDADVIQWLAGVWGPPVNGPYQKEGNRKPCWAARVRGRNAVGWMMMIYQFMGLRRKAKIREVLEKWKAIPAEFKYRQRCKRGHPFDEENTYRSHKGQRICRACSRERIKAWKIKRRTP